MLVDIVIEHGAYRIMGRGHGMEVASKVKVDLFHRQYLCIAATSSSATDHNDIRRSDDRNLVGRFPHIGTDFEMVFYAVRNCSSFAIGRYGT